MQGQDLRINLSALEGEARAPPIAATQAEGKERSPTGVGRSGSGTFLTEMEQEILNSSRRRGKTDLLSRSGQSSPKSPKTAQKDVYLPSISTPRHSNHPQLEIATIPEMVKEAHVRIQPPRADVAPQNVIPLMKEVSRRYYFRQVDEKPMAFLQHFDVVVPGHERNEKLVGGHVLANDSELMRFYYCDFLQVPPFAGEMPFEEGAELDIDTAMSWTQQLNPRTRMDSYPLFLLLKGILKRFLNKEFEFSSRKTRELKLEISSLKDDRLQLVRTVARTRQELGSQLAETSEKLADVEQLLSRERAKRAKLHARVEILARQLELITKERDEITTKLEHVQGQHDFEMFKKNIAAKKAAEASQQAKLSAEASLDADTLPGFLRLPSVGSEGGFSDGGDPIGHKPSSAGFTDGSSGLPKDGADMTPRQRKCAGLIQSLNMAERIEMLNRLVAQPMVLAKLDAKKLAWEASSESKDMIMKQIIEQMNEDQNGDVDGASLMSRVKGTERSDELLMALEGVKRHLGQHEAATVAAKAMGSSPEERLALLRATVELCKSDAAFWDSIAEATHMSKPELVKEVVGQDPTGGAFRALIREGTRKPQDFHGHKDHADVMTDEADSTSRPGGWAGGHQHGHHHAHPGLGPSSPPPLHGQNFRQSTFVARTQMQLRERPRRRSINAGGDDNVKALHDPLRVGRSGSDSKAQATEETKMGLLTPESFFNKMELRSSSPSPRGRRKANVEHKETQTDDIALSIQEPEIIKHPSKKRLQDFVSPPAETKEKQMKGPKISIPAALKQIATIFQAKMEQDKQSDLHKRQRQTMQENVRDFFTQRYGLASVAKQKLAELIATVLTEVSKKGKAHTRISLFHILMGLAEKSTGQETSIDECNFMLALVQELFPSWRYGSAFIKDFSQAQILLHLDVVEFTLERLFAGKKYGGQVPPSLLQKLRGAAVVLNDPKPKKGGTTMGARQKALETKETDKLIDTDFVLEVCHFQYREMEIQSITALMSMMAEADVNGDGVLQFDEFSELLLHVDPMFTSQDVLEMYHEVVGDDDVVDKDELMHLITAKGLRFAVYNRSVQQASQDQAPS